KLAKFSDCRDGEHVRRGRRVLNRTSRIAGRDDTRNAEPFGAQDLLLERFRRFDPAQAQVHEIDLFFNAILESLDELTDSPAWKLLANVNFRLRREAADSASGICAGDDSRAVRSVRERVVVPRSGIGVLMEEVEARLDGAQIGMRILRARIYDRDTGPLS